MSTSNISSNDRGRTMRARGRSIQEGDRVRPMLRCVLLLAGFAAMAAAPPQPNAPPQPPAPSQQTGPPPTIDGVIAPGEWSGARREPMINGGELLLLRNGSDLYVAVTGPKPGFPSLCVGDGVHVEILHASAALGTVTYSLGGVKKQASDPTPPWQRGAPFAWRLRDTPEPSPTLAADRTAFLGDTHWLSTASRTGAPTREFRIALNESRRFFGVVFLATEKMELSHWPATMGNGCRDLALARGDAPDTLQLTPTTWYRIE
jgi:hypothetical protein